ncbi:ABC transporter ATP-binding protein [Paracoccus sp. 1_MG-2023]|uniref:ABC transporter ATP-binding protein n=1 Tax=unclassified Paracoccus (in: a-proteobacteria) TaxID=2688777 RepID=UPI001C092A45|nr:MULTISPECIES: ABC transporter ATP-binding protein [unclassified Paracoccus (in: a-proteobacteria)]MBU2959100.1 ABC transporter ATP-binding protein [Paracoccus sp. C2R09]MDO6669384.1 ABC transporter ATP-binding protein [Paracoccus sp. 1_MG-2023]
MLEIRDLRTGYGPIEVVHGIDLDVREGECVALIGANGAGKSSTLKTVCGLLPARSGQIRFDGQDITNRKGHAIVQAGITMCPEGRQVFPGMTVMQNLRLGAYARKGADLDWMLDMFPILRERANQAAGTLSGGEQEMLAIARALMSQPRLCIFDEPSLGLAPKIVAEVAQTIASIKAMGMTILLVEQNSLMALRLADRAYLFEAGEIVLEGTGAELQTHPEVVKAYLGH